VTVAPFFAESNYIPGEACCGAKLAGNHTSFLAQVFGRCVYWRQITMKFAVDAVTPSHYSVVYLSDGSRHCIERVDTSHGRRG